MLVTPLYLNNWKPGTTIISDQATGEFLNIYNVLNGNIDGTNIAYGSIRDSHIGGNISGDKITSIDASKITGKLNFNQLPDNILTTSGATLSGTIIFDVAPKTPLLKNYDDEEVTLYEGGAGDKKIKIMVGGDSFAVRITLGTKTLWELQNDGTEIPTNLKVPVV